MKMLLLIVLMLGLQACSDHPPGLTRVPPPQDPLGIGDATAGAVSGYGQQVAGALH